MDKKEIYAHLADIYLDSSKQRKAKLIDYAGVRGLFFIVLFTVLSVCLLIIIGVSRNRALYTDKSLTIRPGIVKLTYNSNPFRHNVYSYDLSGLKLRGYSAVAFSVRKVNYPDNVFLKVELWTPQKERSKVTVRGLTDTWQEFRINLSAFDHISDWSKLARLNFIIEDVDTKGKKGMVYIDGVKFLK